MPVRRRYSGSGIDPFLVVHMPFVLLAGLGLICINLLVGQADIGPRSAHAAVTITPSKATLFAGETVVFVATIVGIDDKTVDWAVQEVGVMSP